MVAVADVRGCRGYTPAAGLSPSVHASPPAAAGASGAPRCSGTQRWRRSSSWHQTMTCRQRCRCAMLWSLLFAGVPCARRQHMPRTGAGSLSLCLRLCCLSPHNPPCPALPCPRRRPSTTAVGPAQQRVPCAGVPWARQGRAGHVVVPPGLLLPHVLRQGQPHHLLGRQRRWGEASKPGGGWGW